MTNPRIRKAGSIWQCVSLDGGFFRQGFGMNPKSAYEAWRRDSTKVDFALFLSNRNRGTA